MTEYFKGVHEIRGSIDKMDINKEAMSAVMQGTVSGLSFIATGESPESPETFVGAMREKLRDFTGAYEDAQKLVADINIEIALSRPALHESQVYDYNDGVQPRLKEAERDAARMYGALLKFGQALEFLQIPPETVKRIYEGVVPVNNYPHYFDEEEVPF